jgi:tungstate transport system ATP-binding protein
VESILLDRGTTTVMSTHDATEAMRMADRIAVMHEGRIEQIGPARDVRDRPETQFVARFMGTETIVEGKVVRSEASGTVVEVAGHEIASGSKAREGDGVLLCIRAENVTLHAPTSPQRPDGALEGTVTKITPLGSHTRIHLDCGFPLAALVTDDRLGELSIEKGRALAATVDPSRVHAIPEA